MTTDTRINLTRLRHTAQHHGRDNTTLELSPLETLDLIEAVEAARAFVSTSSSFRQPHSSRPEFAALAEALARFDP